MDLNKLNIAALKPPLYEKGDSIMWTDEYISQKLLELHLNPDIDSASRSLESIDRTLEFISGFCPSSPIHILDLGCGPGLYLQKLAEAGHVCTGIDFSRNSIAYATEQAKKRRLPVTYLCQDYLDLEYDQQFDLILMIYTDLGVLVPEDRATLLLKVHRALKPGGLFIFDVINDRNIDQKFAEEQTWTFEFSGFWKPEPYLELVHGFHYPEHRVYLRQHTIMDESEQIKNYRFWTHYFATGDIREMLSARGFHQTEHFDHILPSKDIWDGENISFYATRK